MGQLNLHLNSRWLSRYEATKSLKSCENRENDHQSCKIRQFVGSYLLGYYKFKYELNCPVLGLNEAISSQNYDEKYTVIVKLDFALKSKVLRFSGQWDSQNKLFGIKIKPYILCIISKIHDLKPIISSKKVNLWGRHDFW